MSRIQFNLLPDVKQDFIKAQKLRNLVITISFLVAGASLAIFIILFISVEVVQKKQISDSQTSINASTKKLKAIPGIEDALVVQNQLHSLVGLHKNKHITSRLFAYLPEITPNNLNITKLDMDYATNVMNITGTANNHSTVNGFIDTLKFTTYEIGSTDTPHRAFTNVVESSFGINSSNATFSLTTQFDPKLFTNGLVDSSGKLQSPKLSVPSLTAQPSSNAASSGGGR